MSSCYSLHCNTLAIPFCQLPTLLLLAWFINTSPGMLINSCQTIRLTLLLIKERNCSLLIKGCQTIIDCPKLNRRQLNQTNHLALRLYIAFPMNLMGLSYHYIGCVSATTVALFGFLPFRRSILELMWFFEGKGPSGFSKWSTAEEVTQGIDGTGLTAIVTGASSGIGRETTRVLALRGVHVVMAVRNIDSGRKVKEAILEENPNAKIDVKELDLGSLASVRNFASEFKSLGFPLNLLINNAGVFAPPFMLSPDKIDLQFQINHLGHFLLTNLLLETMKSTARKSHKEGRIVNVTSMAHRFAYWGIQFDRIMAPSINDESWYSRVYGYLQSKLANLLHAKVLTKRLKEEGVEITANSVHPGCVNTSIMRYLGFLSGSSIIATYLVKNASQGAATTCYVAMHPQVKGISGEYFADSNIANSSSLAKDAELAKKMWDLSLSLTDAK